MSNFPDPPLSRGTGMYWIVGEIGPQQFLADTLTLFQSRGRHHKMQKIINQMQQHSIIYFWNSLILTRIWKISAAATTAFFWLPPLIFLLTISNARNHFNFTQTLLLSCSWNSFQSWNDDSTPLLIRWTCTVNWGPEIE